MRSSFEPSPKKKLGQSPASEAPAHMTGGIAQKDSNQTSFSQIEIRAQHTAATENPATYMRSARGFGQPPVERPAIFARLQVYLLPIAHNHEHARGSVW